MIRKATVSDAEQILDIYSYYIKETAITFEYDIPSIEEFRSRIENTLKKYPYLVEEEDGKILGYAYAGTFKDRAAYDWSVETSIYVDKDLKKKGVGRKLYEALEKALAEQEIINLYACIAYPIEEDEYLTKNSVDFHAHLGYELVGRFHKCAYKFDRWYDMVWMEKFIGEHS
jgi:L-amino acid N-acyltransferase YncA